MIKVCSKCRVERLESDFYRDSRAKDGLQSNCKDCFKVYSRLESTKSRKRESYEPDKRRKNYLDNKEERLLYNKLWGEKNRERRLIVKKANYQRNKSAWLSYVRQRQATKLMASPSWLSKDHKAEIKSFYWLAKDLELVSGQKYHVDHIVPLQGDNVCGLHVPWNLQVLPADINLSKGNKHDNLA